MTVENFITLRRCYARIPGTETFALFISGDPRSPHAVGVLGGCFTQDDCDRVNKVLGLSPKDVEDIVAETLRNRWKEMGRDPA